MFVNKLRKKLLYYPTLGFKSVGCFIRFNASRLGVVSSKHKVFAIGFNKTGTSSLHELFIKLDYHSTHGEFWRKTESTLFHKYFDAFCDGIPHDFVALDNEYPDSKFILQVRDLDTWMSSRIEHIQRRPSNRKNKVSADWTTDLESLESWVRQRNEHHLRILRHFEKRPNDLLIVNFIRDQDAALKISQFLGASPTPEKPHANKNRKINSRVRHSELIAQCLNGMGIPENEWKTDLLCVSILAPEERVEELITDSAALLQPLSNVGKT